jgi:hypothetical protein
VAKIEEDRFWIDIGIVIVADDEMEERYGGYTWMWRTCCLDKVADAFQMKEHEGSKIAATKYNWCMTRDVANLSITGKKRSMIRKGGLMYSQFYSMNKLQFDAIKHFPWDDGDDTMAVMALDPVFSITNNRVQNPLFVFVLCLMNLNRI